MLLLWTVAGLLVATGRDLQARRHYPFCRVMALAELTCAPLGTVPGGLALVLLLQPSVRACFAGQVVETPSDPARQGAL